MNKIICANINSSITGLSNQFFFLICEIIKAYYNNKDIVIFNSFLSEINTDKFIPISEIINMEKFGNYIYGKYKVTIFDKHNFTHKIISIKYGIKDKTVDITKDILNRYYKDGKLNITKKDFLSYTDPMPNFSKKIFIEYSINNIIFKTEYDEYINRPTTDIIFDFSDNKFTISRYGFWPDNINLKMANDIIKNLYCSFNEKFYVKVKEFKSLNKLDNKINVFHLRIEDDAIKHWSISNKIDINIFKQKIIDKYINIIKKYLDPNDTTIILSGCLNNKVIDFMKDNNYKYIFTDKDLNIGRELNGLLDLIIGGNCNNIFIGNYNPVCKNGSSFSYILSQNLNSKIKQILVNMDKINDQEIIYYS
jgi:hypothetical protein